MTQVEPKTDILCLSELKCDESELINVENATEEFRLTANTRDMHTRDRYERLTKATKKQEHGTGIMTKPQLFNFSKTVKVKSARMTLQKINNNEMDLLVGSIYMPTNGDLQAQQDYKDCLEMLVTKVEEVRGDCEVLLAVDFNVSNSKRHERRMKCSKTL